MKILTQTIHDRNKFLCRCYLNKLKLYGLTSALLLKMYLKIN